MIYEWMMIIITLLAGVSVASLLGFKKLLSLIPLGLLVAVVLRTASFSILNLVDQLQLNLTLWFLISFLAIVIGVLRGKFFIQLKALLALAPIAVLAVLIARIERFGSPVYGDPSWILSMTELMQSGADMEILNGRVSIKRGFAFPLMLALGAEGEYLSAFPAVLFIALILAIIWGVRKLAPGANRLSIFIGFTVLLSAPIVIRSGLYLNGHILMALGVTVASVMVISTIRNSQLETKELVALMVSLSVISTTRAEGIAVAALIAIPLIATKWITRKQIMLIVSSATLSTSIWLAVYNSYILNSTGLPWPIFTVVLVGLGLLVAIKPLDAIRHRAVLLAIVAELVVIAVALVVFFDDLQNGLISQFENIFLNQGLWGATLIASFASIAYLLIISKENSLGVLLLMLVMGQLILKMIDGGQFGNPTLGRIGWADSLNRMWLHLSGLFALSFVLVLQKNKDEQTKAIL